MTKKYVDKIIKEAKLTKSQTELCIVMMAVGYNRTKAAEKLNRQLSSVSVSWHTILNKLQKTNTALMVANFVSSQYFRQLAQDNDIYCFIEDFLDRNIKQKYSLMRWNVRRIQNKIEPYGTMLLSKEYKNCDDMLIFRCPCGNVFKRRWEQALSETGFKCNFCSGKVIWNTQLVKEWAKKNDLEFLDEYKQAIDKYRWRCSCGEVFERIFITMYTGQILPLCHKCSPKSKGEERIQKYLENKNIKYINEAIFDGLVNPQTNMPLRYDFYVPDYNTVIEFHGRQHYEESDFFNGVSGLRDLQARDKIKKDFAISNNIRFIEIPYYEIDNIEKNLDIVFNL